MLQNIALCFSGGGYRAAGFSLGILSYFNHLKITDPKTGAEKPLLDNVNGLSTVSGGTITGVMFTLSKAQGKTFEAFFADFYQFMQKDELLTNALKKLEDSSVWKRTFKKQSLINAFTLAYRELLTDDTFGSLDKADDHLHDFCFNATEFTYGVAFRFQNKGGFGNYYYKGIPGLKENKDDFKLADVIASSSCFPLGFEPLIMPDDYFAKESVAYKQLVQNPVFRAGVGILDGGIVDNQGIGSIVLADKRNKNNPYDLILNCDVGGFGMTPWKPETAGKDAGSSINQLLNTSMKWLKNNIAGWVCTLIGLGIITAGYWLEFAIGKWLIFLGTTLLITGLLLLVLKFALVRLYWYLTNKLVALVPDFYKGQLKHFDDVGLGVLKRMMIERLTSGSLMISDVFLKQIRRLNYKLFYESETLKGRRATALIYDLTKSQFKNKASDEFQEDDAEIIKKVSKQIPKPGEKIFNCAQLAADFGTTLWFDEHDKKVNRLDNLVACGQFTACYTLLKFVIKTESKLATPDPELVKIKKALLADWKEFIENPFVLMK